MNEKYIRYLFQLARDDQYPGSMDEFVKRLQTEDNFFNYMLQSARDDQYKGTDEEFSIAIGRTKPQSTQSEPVATEQPAKVEPITTEPAKVTPQAEPQATETVTDNVEEPVKEEVVKKEMPAIQVKEVEAKKEEVVNKEIPKEALNQNIIPITEKTEVKTVEIPSDKMVVKSKKKEEVKEQPKVEGKPKVEVKDVTKEESDRLKVKLKDIKTVPFEPSKKYKPYGEKGPDVYYEEYYDQYVIKEGDKNIIANKGSEKYNELDSKIGDSVKATIEGTGKCDPDTSSDGCSKNGGFLNNFLSLNKDNYEIGFRTTTEGILINKLNEDKEQFEEEGKSRYVKFSDKDLEAKSKEYNMLAGQIWYANDELPKDKRFVIYKPYGNDDTLIYDKESEVILKQVGKAPYVSSRDLAGENDVRQTYKKIQQENPNEGLNVWYGYHKDRPEYKELKSLIDGMDYKKEKGSKNTFVPLTTTPGMQEWSPIPNKK